ncbi:MAG: TlpA disulfide reductase family protein [Ornithinimicrobium sp.]
MNLPESIRDEIASIPVGPGDLEQVQRAGGRRRARRHLAGAIAAVAVIAGATLVGATLGEAGNEPVRVADRSHAAAVNVAGTGGSVLYIPVADRSDPVNVSGKTLHGGVEASLDHRGHVVLIRYWAPWCKPCSSDALTEMTERPDTEIEVIGAVAKARSRRSSSVDFAREQGFDFDSIVAAPQDLFAQFGPPAGPRALPATVALDPLGRVVALKYGQFDSPAEVKAFADLAR